MYHEIMWVNCEECVLKKAIPWKQRMNQRTESFECAYFLFYGFWSVYAQNTVVAFQMEHCILAITLNLNGEFKLNSKIYFKQRTLTKNIF